MWVGGGFGREIKKKGEIMQGYSKFFVNSQIVKYFSL
jgi:hypothetical protein